MKILIVDDDDFTTRLLQIQLRAMGLKDSGYAGIELSSSGADAIELLALAPADFGLVFCDLRMPGMDGVEFVRHLAATEFRGGLVLMSGAEPRVLQVVEQLARQQGLDVLGSLAKPVTPDSLRTLLKAREATGVGAGGTWADGAAQSTTSADAAELETAILGDEIFNHYQPKIDLRTGAVVGVEALARWQHPTRGVVAPAEFLPLAESAGLVTALTRTVLVNALHHAKSWNVAGGLDVAVNVSLASLGRLDFPDRLAAMADEAGFPLERLVLELSESRLPTEPRAQLDILSRLRLKGVRLALDDFGNGFTKLAQLRDMPFSELKIDRAFVQGVASDASRRAIVQAALALARELDVDTVAEGVDNAEDLACLRALGCGMFQGFLVAEPMPACDLSAWLHAWPSLREGVLGT